MSILHLIFALPCLYVLARWLWPLGLERGTTLGLATVLLAGSQYHLWARLSSGSVFAPEFPRPVIIALNCIYGAIVLLAALQVLFDLVVLALAVVRRRKAQMPASLRYAAAALALALAAFGTANALRVPPVRNLDVAIANLPPQFDGYRLLLLSDLHLSRLFPGPWAQHMVERANAAGANAIVVAGDFSDGTVAMRRGDVAPLLGLRAPDGVFGVPGNHEYYFDHATWMRQLGALGVRMLPNAHVVLASGAGRIVLAGVTDIDAADAGWPGPDLDAALRGAPAGAPVILLDHEPRDARKAAAHGVALQLSGHTHGGMVIGLDGLVALSNGGFVSGRYAVAGMTLYVSNGTALWPGFAIRLGRPAEMTQITLRRASRPTGR